MDESTAHIQARLVKSLDDAGLDTAQVGNHVGSKMVTVSMHRTDADLLRRHIDATRDAKVLR